MRSLAAVLMLLALGLPAAAQARGADRDRDGMPNRWERKHRLSPKRPDAARDADRDGASNLAEHRRRTNPRRRDSDRDRLADGYELKATGTSPRRRDTDHDRVPDGAEDGDGDGLDNAAERARHTEPRRRDTDRDELGDGTEISATRTDPLDPDTDGDGWADARELRLGSAPLQAASKPRKPETTVAAKPPALIAAKAAPFQFASTAPNARYECRVNGGPWVPCGPATTFAVGDGGNTLEVRSLNAEEWADESPAKVAWTVDTVAPAVTIAAAPGAYHRSTSAGFSFSASEPDAAFECRLDGAPWAACGAPRVETGLAQGAHAWQVRARDRAGNVSAPVAASPFVVDTVRPNTSIVSSSGATFDFTGTEPGGFECRLDWGPWTPCSAPRTVTGASGWLTFRVRAVDLAGNRDSSPASRNFYVAP
jgi:thrombospondin type 3 repeat protein